MDKRGDQRGEGKIVCMIRGMKNGRGKDGEGRSKGGQRGGEAKRGREVGRKESVILRMRGRRKMGRKRVEGGRKGERGNKGKSYAHLLS